MQAIAAMDPYRVIGHHGRIPWHYTEDFQWFKSATMGQALLMGRTTFESIGKPLPGRFTYILTTDPTKLLLPPGEHCCYVNGDWVKNQISSFPTKLGKNLWVCGGARVYKEFVPLCDSVYVTHISDEYEGDTYMPEFEDTFPNSEIVKETKDFVIARYWKTPVPEPPPPVHRTGIHFTW